MIIEGTMTTVADLISEVAALKTQMDYVQNTTCIVANPSCWFVASTTCYFYSSASLPLPDADTHCKSLGGQIAQIPTMADLRILQSRSQLQGWSQSTAIGGQCSSSNKMECTYTTGFPVAILSQGAYGPGEPDSSATSIQLGLNVNGLFDGDVRDRPFLCSAPTTFGFARA